MFERKAMEQNDLVEPVEEFGAEMAAHHIHHLWLDIRDLLVVIHIGQILAAEVRREDDQRIAEVYMRKLAKTEGIFAGVSSGAAAWAATQVAKANPNAVIAFIVCDRGDRYLSTGLYNVDDSNTDNSSAEVN